MKTTGQYDPALEPLGVIDRLEVGPVTVRSLLSSRFNVDSGYFSANRLV